MKGGLPEEFEAHNIDMERAGQGSAMIIREVSFVGNNSGNASFKALTTDSFDSWSTTFNITTAEEFTVSLISKEGVSWEAELYDPNDNLIRLKRSQGTRFTPTGAEVVYRKSQISLSSNKTSDSFTVKSGQKGSWSLTIPSTSHESKKKLSENGFVALSLKSDLKLYQYIASDEMTEGKNIEIKAFLYNDKPKDNTSDQLVIEDEQDPEKIGRVDLVDDNSKQFVSVEESDRRTELKNQSQVADKNLVPLPINSDISQATIILISESGVKTSYEMDVVQRFFDDGSEGKIIKINLPELKSGIYNYTISVLGKTEIGDTFERNTIGALKVLSTVAELADVASIIEMPPFNNEFMDEANKDRIAFSIKLKIKSGDIPKLVKTYAEVWAKTDNSKPKPITWISGIIKTQKGLNDSEYSIPMSMHIGWALLSGEKGDYFLKNVRVADVDTSITLAKIDRINLSNHDQAKQKLAGYRSTFRSKAGLDRVVISDEMLFGSYPYKTKSRNKVSVNTGKVNATNHGILLVHGMGVGPDMWRLSDFNYNYGKGGSRAVAFDDSDQNQLNLASYECTSNYRFAKSINNFINSRMQSYSSISIIAHSQGGLAALTLYDDYLSSKVRVSFAPRPIQTIGTPFNGTASAMLGFMSSTMGLGCAPNTDLFPAFAGLNLSYISSSSKKAVYFGRTTGGKYLGCSGISPLLAGDDDGVVSVSEGYLSGGNDAGIRSELCHWTNMTYATNFGKSLFNKSLYRWSYPSYDVGVIKESSCGTEMEEVAFYMDDEDSRNASRSSGWNGVSNAGRNTRWVVCRVKNGVVFKPLTTFDVKKHYSLLRLGTECPPGSLAFNRYFDNEDDSNRNSYGGDIFPSRSDRNTSLNYCYFGNASSSSQTMASFPDLGISYGVYASWDFALRLSSGYRYTDDEDDRNKNSFTYSSGLSPSNVSRMIYGGGNTVVRMVKVK